MLNNWKERILSGWSLMRIIRLGLAIIVLMEAWKNSEIMFALLGGILFFQAMFNVGCCGSQGCDINHSDRKVISSDKQKENITFKEIE